MIHILRTRRRPEALEWLVDAQSAPWPQFSEAETQQPRRVDALPWLHVSEDDSRESSPRPYSTTASRTGLAVPHKMPSDSFLCGPAEFALTALSSASHLKPMRRSTHWAARSRTQGAVSRVSTYLDTPASRRSICAAGGDADTALAVLGTSSGFGDILLHRAQRGRQ
jgi:hypothetical protein